MQSSKTTSAVIIHRSTLHKLAWWFKVALAFIVALLVWELLLSQLILQKPTSHTHAILGRIYGQGLYVQGKEGYGRTVLNELGLRSPSLKEEPLQASAQRVLVLGDSYTQAMQVSDSAAFPQQLNELLGDYTQVINAGREGASPADYIALAEYNQQTFNPDVVVVQLNEADFTRDLLSDNQTFYYQKTDQNYTLEENKAVVSSNALATQFSGLQSVLNFSVVRVVLERIEAMRSNEGHEVTAPTPVATDKWGDGSLEHFIVQELQRTYKTPVLLYIPEIDYFSEDYAKVQPTEKYLYEAARDAGVTFISLRPDFVSRYNRTHETAHGFANTQPGIGHINTLGHSIAAERLARTLQLPAFENSLSEVKR
jgi:hypothetical protein